MVQIVYKIVSLLKLPIDWGIPPLKPLLYDKSLQDLDETQWLLDSLFLLNYC